MIEGIFSNVFGAFKPFIFGILKIFSVPIIYYVVLVIIFILYYRFIKGDRPERIATVRRNKEHNIFVKILFDAPKFFAWKKVNRTIGEFIEHGIVLFEGKQGNGKTLAITKSILDLQQKYPECKVITNYGLKSQTDELTDWHQLLHYNNGKKGVVVAIDELPNWFSSADSKNFPPEMLEVVTQNRKNKRIIYGTCHTFSMVSKNIRIQTSLVGKCRTFFGCCTFIRFVEPEFDSTGDVQKWNTRKRRFFVHSKDLYDAYDTYRIIERYQEKDNLDVLNSLQVEKN